jgi:hypothetical protein
MKSAEPQVHRTLAADEVKLQEDREESRTEVEQSVCHLYGIDTEQCESIAKTATWPFYNAPTASRSLLSRALQVCSEVERERVQMRGGVQQRHERGQQRALRQTLDRDHKIRKRAKQRAQPLSLWQTAPPRIDANRQMRILDPDALRANSPKRMAAIAAAAEHPHLDPHPQRILTLQREHPWRWAGRSAPCTPR